VTVFILPQKYYGEQQRKQQEAKEAAKGAVPTPSGKYNDGYDNEDGEYIVTPGEYLGYDRHYQIVKKIGNGQFGQVVKAWDKQKRCAVAIKIIKNRRVFLDQAQHEIEILTKLQTRVKVGESVLGMMRKAKAG